MIARWKRWQRQRILTRQPLADSAWRQAVAQWPLLLGLETGELQRLRQLSTLLLHHKQFFGAQGFEVSGEMALLIAVQACLPILNLDIDDYSGWRSVVVYPRAFVVEFDAHDEAGVVHRHWQARAGEAWEQGAVILSWADICADLEDGAGNVVIHEFAHKLDMQNGAPNGSPPLPAEMRQRAWTAALQGAFDALNAALDRGDETAIDPYAAEDPAEFFAVTTELFFLDPALLLRVFPAVYAQLAQYYRQNPVARDGVLQ